MRTIPLTRNNAAIVDDDMYAVLSRIKWHSTNNGYARWHYHYAGKQKALLMHQAVAGFPLKGFLVDHINGNKLDNRRANLRVVPARGNNLNLQSHREGRLPGAVKTKTPQKRQWRALIKVKGRSVFLGYFATELEAHTVYMKAAEAADRFQYDPTTPIP